MLFNKKYDIFISYRHNNMTLIGELVHKLEKYYDIFWDQRLGSGYWDTQLERAIDNSSVVIINFNRNSLPKNTKGEDWFYREILYSMNQKRQEEIIPVCYDGFNFPENFDISGITVEEKEKLEILRDRYQRIIDIKELDKIVEKIVEYITALGINPKEEYEVPQKGDVFLKLTEFAPVQSFCGRESEIVKLAELVHINDIVFLSGMGGIGKTELAKKFVEEMTGAYRCIFCRYEGSLKNTLSKIEIVGFDSPDFSDRQKVLKELLGRNVLLIIDNFDFDADEEIDEFIYEFGCYDCKKLITTRNTFTDIDFRCQVDTMILESLSDEELKKLFEEKYKKEITASQLERVLEITGRLTLAVPIFASFCEKSGITVDELCEKANKGLREFDNSETIHYSKDGNKKGNVPEILRFLFNMGNMSEGKKMVLCNLSLLQFMYVTKGVYREFVFGDGKGNLDELNELAATNWIKEICNSDGDVHYELHPLINELVKSDLKPSFANCPEVFDNIRKMHARMFSAGISAKEFLKGFFNSVDFTIPENYSYLIKLLKEKRKVLDSSHETYEAMGSIVEKIKYCLFEKDFFDDDDVFVFNQFCWHLKENTVEYKKLIVKCFEGYNNKSVSRKVITSFIKKYALYEYSAISDLNGYFDLASPAGRIIKRYSKRYKRINKILSADSQVSVEDKEYITKEMARLEAAFNAVKANVKNAETIEQAFIAAEAFWRRMDIETFFRDDIFLKFIHDDMTAEDAQNIVDETVKRYGSKDLRDEYGIDAGIFLVFAFVEACIQKNPRNVFSYELCKKFLVGMDGNGDTDRILSCMSCKEDAVSLLAAVMCGEEGRFQKELERILYERQITDKTPEELDRERSALCAGISFRNKFVHIDNYADCLFEYVKKIESVFGQEQKYEGTILSWYKTLSSIFKDENLRNTAQKGRSDYALKIMGYTLKKTENKQN